MKRSIAFLIALLAIFISLSSVSLIFLVKPDSDVESESIVETEPAPVIKTFDLYIWGSGLGNPDNYPNLPYTFSYEEGMTWVDFCESDYGAEFTYNADHDKIYYDGTGMEVVSFDETIEPGSSPNSYTPVSPTDIIQFDQYGSDT